MSVTPNSRLSFELSNTKLPYNLRSKLRIKGILKNIYDTILGKTNKGFFLLVFPNNSFNEINDIINKDSNVKMINFLKNYGKATALSEAFKIASGKIVITIDADLQDDPSEIKNMIQKINEGWDLVSGWKKNRKDPIMKKIVSKIFNFVTRLKTGIRIHDFNCGLKAYKSKVIKSLNIYGGLHRFIPYLVTSKGFSVTEVAVNHRSREFGNSKYGGSRMFKGFFDFLSVLFITKYSKRPLHIFGFIGFLLFIIFPSFKYI